MEAAVVKQISRGINKVNFFMYVEILVEINIHSQLTDKKKRMSIQIHANVSYESRHLEAVKNHKNIFFQT